MSETSHALSDRPQKDRASIDQRAMKILAKSVYRELRSSGATRSDVVGFTSLLLDLVTTEGPDASTPAE